MRIPGTKIWRAFPELDAFDDQRGARFVRAARRHGRWRRAVRVGLCTLTGLIGGGGAFVGGLYGFQILTESPVGRAWDSLGVMLLVVFMSLSLGIVPAILLRDWLLRRQIRRIIARRSLCLGCGYKLADLPVSDARVTCPECGHDAPVDADHGEVRVDEEGRGWFVPREGEAVVFWTRRKVRVLVAGIVVLVLGGAGWWGLERWWKHVDAQLAAAERPGPAGYASLVQSWQPASSQPGDPDALDVLRRCEKIRTEAEYAVRKTYPELFAAGNKIFIDYMLNWNEPLDTSNPIDFIGEARELWGVNLTVQDLAFEQLRANGLMDELDRLASARRAVWNMNYPPSQPSIVTMLPELQIGRQFAKINALRIRRAFAAGDSDELRRAIASNIGVCEAVARCPSLLGWLVSVAIEAMTDHQIMLILSQRPDAATLDAIEAGLNQPREGSIARVFEAERLDMLDFVGWYFEDPDTRRTMLAAMTSMPTPVLTRFGRYAANRDKVNEYYDWCQRQAALPVRQRTPESRLRDYPLLEMIQPAITKVILSTDALNLTSSGVGVMIALERFRLTHGHYPERLEELVGGELGAVPMDPYGTGPLGYKRVDAMQDPQGRGYLLYSVGIDGVDNGGLEKPGKVSVYVPYDKTNSTYDFILNDYRR